MKSRFLLLLALGGCLAAGGAAERVFKPSFPRPAFDKSAHAKTLWSTANPWWPPNLSHHFYDRGGPDYSWDDFSPDRVTMWKEVAQKYHAFGLTGIQMETASFVNGAQEAAYGFAESGTGMQVIPFMQVHGQTAEEAAAFMLNVFGKFNDDLWKHPGFYRLDGRPVVFIYRATKYDAEYWKAIISAVEEKYGSMVWLFDAAMVGMPKGQWLPKLRGMLQYFDGISMYGNWSAGTRQELFDAIAPVMKREFPEKIFEGAVHTNYTNHHWYGGVDPDLTSKYRGSWEMVLASQPGSISVTNWFDILENSRIMPSYEQEDICLKILEHYAARWRGLPVPVTESPLIYSVYPTHVLLGQYMPAELVVFPCAEAGAELRMQLEFYAGDAACQYFDQYPLAAFVLGAFEPKASSDFSGQALVDRRCRCRWCAGAGFESGSFQRQRQIHGGHRTDEPGRHSGNPFFGAAAPAGRILAGPSLRIMKKIRQSGVACWQNHSAGCKFNRYEYQQNGNMEL
jgi:hypothetical protein